MNQICATKIWRIKHFWEFRHFLRKPDRCPACLISFRAAAASGAPQRRAAHVFQWESDRSRTTCESSLKRTFFCFTLSIEKFPPGDYFTCRLFKDTGPKNQTPLSFVMLNYFRTNQYEEPWLLVAWLCTLKYEYWIEVNYDWRRTPLH